MPKRTTEVSVREMKDRLSKYLRRAQAGEDIVITHRGRPVARLVPASPEPPTEAEVIARIRALPWVRPGSGRRIKGAQHPISWKPGDRLASDLVLEDRG